MATRLHRGDLPDLSRYGREVAIDTETMGLDPHRDRLCVVQLSPGDGSADVVQIPQEAGPDSAPNLVKLLTDPAVTKIFHYARFDVAGMRFAVASGGERPEGDRHTGIGIVVPDVDAAYEELNAKGVRFTMAPSRQPWGGYMAMFADPDGNVFYLDGPT